jgi:predicted glycosyltransferase
MRARRSIKRGRRQRAGVWVDLSNAPHVPFFQPIVSALEARGIAVTLTARTFNQTAKLAERVFPEVTVIDGAGRGLAAKTLALSSRAVALANFARPRRFLLGISHNSYAQLAAAYALRLPSVTMMDYEFQPANHLAFRLAGLVMVPEVFPEGDLRRFGARNVHRYPGLKEEVYLGREPQAEDVRSVLDIGERIFAVLRPPPDFALYHRFENPLFPLAVDHALSHPQLVGLFLPRTEAQATWAATRWRSQDNLIVANRPFRGEDLLTAADLVIGGGGTMNREAALLGTPVYSLFAGRPSAVDAHLASRQLLTFIRHADELTRISIGRKEATAAALPAQRLALDSIMSRIFLQLDELQRTSA